MNSARFRRIAAAAASVCVVVVAAIVLGTRGGMAPSPPAPDSPAIEVRELRLGLNIAAGSALHAAALRFAELVGQRGGGRLRVTVHPDQQLGNDDQMLEMARAGKLDLVLIPTAKLSSAIPAMQYADLPFYFDSREELHAMLDGEPGRMLLSKLGAIDLVGLTFWENGFKQLTANRPLRRPEDFAGLRIRTMKSRLIGEQFEKLGAQPVPIDFHATWKALADGAVDGQENPLVAIVGMRFHEVQKHLTLSNHAWLGYVFAASKRSFAGLSPELRTIIEQAARELTLWERAETLRRESDFLAQVSAAGVTVHTLTAEERARFAAVLAPLADRFGFEVGYDLLAKTEELRLAAAGRNGGERAPLLIGLDADLSSSAAQGGGAILRGLQLAIDDINQRGGLLGAPLRLLALDHGGNPQIGRRNLERFAATPRLLAVVGGMHTAVIVDELADIHRLELPYLIPWATGHELTAHEHQPSYTFRVSLNDAQVAPLLLERALRAGTPVAILLDRSAWGRSNGAALQPLVERLPSGSASIHWITSSDANIGAEVERIVGNGARSIVMVTDFTESREIVRALARQERPPPAFAHWGLTGGDFWTQTQTALARVDLRFVQSILLQETGEHRQLAAFERRYRARYGLPAGQPIPTPVGSIQAYDVMQLLARAVTQARSSDRRAIRNALETLPRHAGVLRDYHPAFTARQHDALAGLPLHLARFDERGRIVAAE